MTNELLGYVKEAVYAVIGFLVIMGWLRMTEEQIGALILAIAAVGALALRVNSIREGGAPQVLKAKAEAYEEAGIVASSGPPPTTP